MSEQNASRSTRGFNSQRPAELFLPYDVFDFKAYWADKLNIVALGSLNRPALRKYNYYATQLKAKVDARI